MFTRVLRAVTALIVLVLLLVAAHPASAQDTAPETGQDGGDPSFLVGRDEAPADFPLVPVIALGAIGLIGLAAASTLMGRSSD
jgi:hypothetical protein